MEVPADAEPRACGEQVSEVSELGVLGVGVGTGEGYAWRLSTYYYTHLPAAVSVYRLSRRTAATPAKDARTCRDSLAGRTSSIFVKVMRFSWPGWSRRLGLGLRDLG